MATTFTEPEQESKPAEPKLIRPVKRLADQPVVATDNDVLIALAELSWLETKSTAVNKMLTAELDAVRKKYQRHHQVDSHATAAAGEAAPQTLDARRADLEASVCVYAKANKDSLVTEKLKTHDFGIGTVAFKLSPLSLMSLIAATSGNPKPLDDALTRLLSEQEIPQAIERKLKTTPAGFPRPLSDFLRVSINWDTAAIVTLVKDDLVKSQALKPLGIKVERADERIEIRLKA